MSANDAEVVAHLHCEPEWCEVAAARAAGRLHEYAGTSGAFYDFRIAAGELPDESGVSVAG